jgi:plastocyanin
MRSYLLSGLTIAATAALWGCGGGGGSSSGGGSPSSPSTPNPTTVTIVASAGNGAFTPNPVQVASGTPVVFQNNTADTHHIVMDNGTVVGDIAPRAASGAMQVGSGNYHCTIHPSMVGSVNGAVAPTPPPGSGDGY